MDGETSLTNDSIIDPGKAGRLWPGLSLDLLHNPPHETDELDVTDVSAYTPSKLAPVPEAPMPQPTASNSGIILISNTYEININFFYRFVLIKILCNFELIRWENKDKLSIEQRQEDKQTKRWSYKQI